MKSLFQKNAKHPRQPRRDTAGIIGLRQRSAERTTERYEASKSDNPEISMKSARDSEAYKYACEASPSL